MLISAFAMIAIMGVPAFDGAHAQVGPRALPALLTTPRLLRPESTAVTLAGSAGYGVREKFGGADGVRHTGLGALALALNSPRGIGGELRLDGRFEVPESAAEKRFASVGEVRGYLRFGKAFTKSFDFGFEFGVWVPGGKAPSFALDATTVDALMVFDKRITKSWALIGAAGFRLDHSKQAMPADRLSRDDYVVLGLTSWNSALARLGSELTLGRTRTFVEWTWDPYVGATAPGLMKSPMFAALGTRVDLDRRGALVLNLSARALVSQRAQVDLQGPVIPFPPRAELWTGLAYTFGGKSAPEAQKPAEPKARPTPAALPKPEPTPIIADATEAPAEVGVQIVGSDGRPIAGASVQVGTLEPTVTDAAGEARFRPVPFGEQQVTVSAEGFAPKTATMQVGPGLNPKLALPLEVSHPSGQLRFLVRDHETGDPLEANIVVTPLNGNGQVVEHKAGADGRFELELAPGRYDVNVKLYGWRKQRKTVEIEDESVTLIDAALHARSKNKRKR